MATERTKELRSLIKGMMLSVIEGRRDPAESIEILQKLPTDDRNAMVMYITDTALKDREIKFEFIKSLEGAIPTKQDRALLRVIAHDDNYKGNKYLRAEKFGDILRRLRGEPRRKRTKTKGQIKTYQNNTEKFINAVVSGKVTPLDAVRKIFDADPSGRMRVTELSARNNDFLRKIATVLPEINTQVLTFNLTGKQIHKRISALRKIINTRLDAMDDKYERTETPIIGKNNNSKYTPVNSQARKDLSSGNSSKFMESINHVLKNVHL